MELKAKPFVVQTRKLKVAWALESVKSLKAALFPVCLSVDFIQEIADHMILEQMMISLNAGGLTRLFAIFDAEQIGRIAGGNSGFANRLADPDTK